MLGLNQSEAAFNQFGVVYKRQSEIETEQELQKKQEHYFRRANKQISRIDGRTAR
jgi:hypothetical protein